jgi:undecaprenyl-diphosphatase
MDFKQLLGALFMGVVEGLTEFLPISSTGHLVLFGDLIGFEGPPGKVFEIVVQLGAILAVVWLFRERFIKAALGFLTDPEDRRFVLNVALAVIPALAIGFFAHGFIKAHLLTAKVVAIALILGGVAILVIERNLPAVRYDSVERMPLWLAVAIGVGQCVAMIPGVSRAGATIMAALLLGVQRRTAAEFSFFLAVPTMIAATVYDLWKNRATLSFDGSLLIAIGFVAAFVSALIVVRWFIGFVGRHGFGPFAWYRIILGTIILAILAAR